jgi:antitoxin (DNA-binding transcriptional repressor) of toxin-antitoxin stability system
MVVKVSAMEIRERLGDILNRVALRQGEFIIERKGKAMAAMVPMQKLEQLKRLARLRLQDALESGKASLSQKEADALADEAKHSSRARKAK